VPDVVTIGEVLADLVPDGDVYRLHPGGAVSNVAVNLSRWGVSTGVLTRLGDDHLGRLLFASLDAAGVDTTQIRFMRQARTGLVFVYLDRHGERDFTFYGTPSADQFLDRDDIRPRYVRAARILHYGSISMMSRTSRAATLEAIAIAREAGALVSFDPNVRLNLWTCRHEAARREIRRLFRFADVIKLSVEELRFLFGVEPRLKEMGRLFRRGQLVFISAGRRGCYVRFGSFFEHVPVRPVKAVDTTGAGDAFMAGVLFMLLRTGKGLDLGPSEVVAIARFANGKGAEAVRHRGAVPSGVSPKPIGRKT